MRDAATFMSKAAEVRAIAPEQSGSGERLDQGFGRRRRMDARELHCRQRLDAPTEASHSRKAQTKQRYILSIPLVFKIKMCV